MSNDTSLDSENERFKEAIDENFLTEDLYNSGDLKNKDKNCAKVYTSFRNDQLKIESHNPFSIKVTPEFQKHIARHLDKKLNEIIDDSEVFIQVKKLTKRNVQTGVKLLINSKSYLCLNKTYSIETQFKKENGSDSEKIFKERAKQVAVTPEWILSQKETKHWAPCTKGEVEVVKFSKKAKKLKT